ncbi:nuclear transport factor 2 family protein [bacterium]|nr:nuclear transport factor 2 family protein [bacterium]
MRNLLLIVLALMLITAVSCHHQQPAQTPAPKQVDIQAIVDLLTQQQMAYAQAWSNKDFAAISEMWSHDPDITIWGPAVRDRVEGWEGPNGVKAWYESAMASMSKVDFKINGLKIKVSPDGTAAVVTYYVDNDFVDNNGKPGKMNPRVTVVKVLQDGAWKQIHGDASYSIEEVKAMK